MPNNKHVTKADLQEFYRRILPYLGGDGETVPQGELVVPVNNVQVLLKCANINNKSYTTLSELIADTTSLNTVITNLNAINYLVRCYDFISEFVSSQTAMNALGSSDMASDALLSDNSWFNAICDSIYFELVLNIKIPTMSSDIASTGEITSASDFIASENKAYYACDGDNNSQWHSNSGAQHYWQIYFPIKTKINKYFYIGQREDLTARNLYGKIQASNDGVTWVDLMNADCTTKYSDSLIISNNSKYHYYRLFSTAQYFVQTTIQLYGRH